MEKQIKIRQPIVTVVGHVDHGKTSILDRFRGTAVQKEEKGGITQKISYTKFPLDRIKEMCPLINGEGIKLDIPGFLFIDTPGHAAFTNLRKRGGSLADLAILVVSIKEGIKPQTAEVLQILRSYKTPFLIAFNKLDSLSGWKQHPGDLKGSIGSQALHVSDEFQEALLTFQGALSGHGFDSALYYEIDDFRKKIAIVPCSARTGEGMSELLYVLCGLSQRFLKERLEISKEAKGVVLEVKKDKSMDYIESILYDGILNVGDNVAIASFGEPIMSKVRAIEEIEPLSFKYHSVKTVGAASGLRISLTNKEGVLPGMPFQTVDNNVEEVKKLFRKELSGALSLDKEGIIVKADSLGSLDALITLLRQSNIKIVKAGIGNISKSDLVSAKTNLEINALDAVIVGFNVELEEGLEKGEVKIFTDGVIYKLIENLQDWRGKKNEEIEKERMMGLATICKLEVLPKFVFRNSNPAIFGVRVVSGRLRAGLNLIDDKDEDVGRVKGIQHDKESVDKAIEGQEIAISLPGVNFERRLKDTRYLYSNLSAKQFNEFKKNKDLLSASEIRTLQEIAGIKKF